MKTLKVLLIFASLNSISWAQNTSYYGGRNEGEGVSEGFKIIVDFSRLRMYDTMYFAFSNIHNYNIANPDKPKEWVSVFKSINAIPIHISKHRVTKDSIFYESEKCILEGGDWYKFSFSGKLSKNGLKGILKDQYCSSYKPTKVIEGKNNILFLNEN